MAEGIYDGGGWISYDANRLTMVGELAWESTCGKSGIWVGEAFMTWHASIMSS